MACKIYPVKNAAFSERPFRSASVYFILFTFVFSPFLVFSQNGENPNLDQLPGSMVNRLLAPRSITTSSSVITVNNWDNFTLGIDFAESNMTANPSTPAHYFTAYNINTAHHAENGLDWVSVIPDFGATMQGDPVVATDGIGNLFYGNMYGSSSIEGLKVIKSSDNGATWGPGVTALDGNDKCWIACDQTSGPNANNVYACMTNNGVGNFSRSIDHGNTFTSTFAPATQTIPGMMVCVGPYSNTPGGSVYVVTNSGSSFSSVYTFYRSLDGGVTFTEMSAQQFANYVGTNVNGRNSVSGMRTRPYPLIAADNSSGAHHGRLYLVYASNDPPGDGNKPDIFSRYSDNGGTTWSPAKKVNDDTGTENNSQWHPAIWCDKDNGRLYVQWMDTRDTPTHDSASIYATYSSDGGVTFAANQKISNEKMQIDCPTCGGGGTPRYQGDYNGICSNKKVSMAGWTDFRYGSFLSTTSYFPDFAMTLDHSLDTLITVLDSTTFTIAVPEVKLYSDTVLLSGTVFPDPVSGTLVISFPSGNRITAFPGSLPARVKLTGNVPVGDYQLQFFAKGPNGTPVHERNATLRVLSRDSVYVTASATPDKICAGASSQLQATTLSGTGPYSYSWTPVTGLNNPTIANPIASPTVNTWYRVHVTDAASHSASDSVLVSIVPVPNPPASINGPAFICTDSVAGYSVQPVSGASSYSWTVPAGAQILSGQNTTAIIVQWGNTGGSVSVIAGNQCGNSNPSVLAVTVSGPPLQPAGIKGPAQVCSSANVIYSVDPVPEAASYFWTVPADATILSGQNTDSISVGWGANAGDVSIAALNSCGESPSRIRSIALETVPGSPGTITGNDTVCSNHESYPYSIAVIPGATSYKWVTPQGTTITSGSGTNSIVISINPSAVSGPVSVQGSNTCGLGITGSKNITVRICTGISENNMETGISIYPNPAEDLLNIDIRGGEKQIELHLLDVRGQIVYREPMENIPAGHEYKIDVSLYSRGIYFIEMISSKQVLIKKIILQ